MLKKRIVTVAVLCLVMLGGAMFFLHNRHQPGQNEFQKHLDKLRALSGKLTPEEKQVYFDTTLAIIELEKQHPLSQEQLDLMAGPLRDLQRENPDLVTDYPYEVPHSHPTDQAHPTQEEVQAELDKLNAAIEEVEASELSRGAKDAMLAVLEHRRYFLLHHERDAARLQRMAEELMKTDPDMIGLEQDLLTGEYTKVYPHMLTVYRKRTHHADGTIVDQWVGTSSHASTPEIGAAIQAYLEALDSKPAWAPPPAPPAYEELRFSVEYEDVYLNAAGEEITGEPLQHAEQSEDATEAEPIEPPPVSPAPVVPEAESASLQDALEELKDVDDAEALEMHKLFEQVMGIPLERFLEMSDAEIEAALHNQFSPDSEAAEAGLEKQITSPGTHQPDVSSEEGLKVSLRERFSPARFNRAMQTLNRHGPEEGIRRLQASDPEVAEHVTRFLRRQQAD